ncbi:MAG: NADH-quinone oxidoreductase subunit J [Nitrososphaerota archaeon]|nr:NADH-quinone oxidoreductase subunit J [Nitrososphaerota archaeon]
MPYPEIELALLIIALISAVFAVESGSLIRSVFGLLFFTTSVGLIFVSLGALHVGLFQILVYSGGIVALFIAVIMLTRRREEE